MFYLIATNVISAETPYISKMRAGTHHMFSTQGKFYHIFFSSDVSQVSCALIYRAIYNNNSNNNNNNSNDDNTIL
jgi:hypothetical protein